MLFTAVYGFFAIIIYKVLSPVKLIYATIDMIRLKSYKFYKSFLQFFP